MQEHIFVIPAYKDSPFLEDCILSLSNQTLKSSIIITTATPSDYVDGIAKKFQLPYYVNTDKPSISDDWNFALSKANAKLVTIAHQDDIYENTYLERVVEAIKMRKNVLIVFTDYDEIANEAPIKFSLNLFVKRMLLSPFIFSKSIGNKFFKKAVLSLGDPICCPSVTINKQLLPQFKFSDEFACALDWMAWLELAKLDGHFLYINEKLLKHRIHKGSETTNQIMNGRRLQEEEQILQSIWGKNFGKLISKIYSFGQKGNLLSS